MVHTATRSPLSATIAVITAGAIVLGTNTIDSPKPSVVALTAPTISTQAVHLTALAGPLPAARAATVSDDLAKVGEVLQNIPNAIFLAPVAGAGAGIFLGFIGGGSLAASLIGALVPEQFYDLVSPIIPVVAVLGAIIGAPIGAVVGPIIAAANLVNTLLSPSNASATASARIPAAASEGVAVDTPHRTSPPRVRPQRSSLAKASAPSADQPKAARRASTPNAVVPSAAATRAPAPSQPVATSHSTAQETPGSEHHARSARVARD